VRYSVDTAKRKEVSEGVVEKKEMRYAGLPGTKVSK